MKIQYPRIRQIILETRKLFLVYICESSEEEKKVTKEEYHIWKDRIYGWALIENEEGTEIYTSVEPLIENNCEYGTLIEADCYRQCLGISEDDKELENFSYRVKEYLEDEKKQKQKRMERQSKTTQLNITGGA